MLIRTTLRLQENLKKTAERKALNEDITLQEIFNRALREYLEKDAKKEAKRIVFKSHHLGKIPLLAAPDQQEALGKYGTWRIDYRNGHSTIYIRRRGNGPLARG